MRIELTVKVTYLPGWGAWEGVRELVQNARDEEVCHKSPMTAKHTGRLLRLFNEGSLLKHRDLLFGQTDKADRDDLAGQFGEGLKLGSLALIRSGHDVKIRTGNEIWTPTIEHSRQFNEKVLVFNIRKGKDVGGTMVEIGGIDLAQWVRWRERFLFLAPLDGGDVVEVPGYGRILLKPTMNSKLFVKGIFVQDDSDYQFGYDLDNADVDRDRKLISHYDVRWRTAVMWRQAVSSTSGQQIVGDFYNILVKDSLDIRSLGNDADNLSEEVVDNLKARFEKVHGNLAIPVTSLAQSRNVGYMGFKGVIVGSALMNALLARSGGLEGLRQRASNDVAAICSWHDLSDKEQNVFNAALEHFAWSDDDLDTDALEIVRFRDERINGMYKDGKILISRGQLEHVSETLGTLIHEYAHRYDSDGGQDHVCAIERIWRAIHKTLTE